MSMTDPDEPHEHDPDHEMMQARWKVDADKLLERAADIDDTFRKIGLYIEGQDVTTVQTPFGPKPALLLAVQLGDVAFARRVQDPEAEAMERQFKEMAAGMVGDDFLDARARMARNIAAGRDPLDDGDDDDGD